MTPSDPQHHQHHHQADGSFSAAPAPAKKKSNFRAALAGAAFFVVLTAAGLGAMSLFGGPASEPSALPASTSSATVPTLTDFGLPPPPPSGSDNASDDLRAERTARFASFRADALAYAAGGGAILDSIDRTGLPQPAGGKLPGFAIPTAQQVAGYIAAVITDPTTRDRMIAATADGTVRWVSVGLYDDQVIDGDTVIVTAGPVQVAVLLGHAVQYVLVPVIGKTPTAVTIQGVNTGGDVVSVGIFGPGGSVPTPPLSEGEVVTFHAF
jgi:hypothetical protein